MLSAAFRTTLTTVCVLLALGGTATVADAAPNTGKFQRTEAMKVAWARNCNAAFGALEDQQDLAEDLAEDGDIAGSEAASKSADEWWAYGVKNGCSWAQ